VLVVYETARKYALAHPDEVETSFITVTKLPKTVVEKQLRERTDLSNGRIGARQRETILAAGLALQQAGVIKPDVDVKKVLDELIDEQFGVATN
jgi:sulfonate transport system substrate-binding protein